MNRAGTPTDKSFCRLALLVNWRWLNTLAITAWEPFSVRLKPGRIFTITSALMNVSGIFLLSNSLNNRLWRRSLRFPSCRVYRNRYFTGHLPDSASEKSKQNSRKQSLEKPFVRRRKAPRPDKESKQLPNTIMPGRSTMQRCISGHCWRSSKRLSGKAPNLPPLKAFPSSNSDGRREC